MRVRQRIAENRVGLQEFERRITEDVCHGNQIPLVTPELLNRIVIDHLRAGGGDGKTGPYGSIAVFRSDVDKHLSKIEAPTLLLWGTDDLTSFGFPKESEEKVNNAIPHRKVVTIEGGTFATPNLLPERFAQHVLDFLENPDVGLR